MRFVGTALAAGTIVVSFLLVQGEWILAGTGQLAVEKATSQTGREVVVAYSHFRNCRGMTVENVDGEKLGTVNDLIMELHSGRPAYVIVRSSGYVVSHRRLVIVPISAIAITTAKVGIAAVDITRRKWKHAPEFSKRDLSSLAQPEKAEQIARFYGQAEEAAHGKAAKRQNPSLSSTGRAELTMGQTQYGRYESAKTLIGNELIALQEVKIGTVTDLLVDFGGTKPTFTIVSTDGPSGAGARFVVPLRSLGVLPERKMAIRAIRQDFEHAPPFRERDLPNATGNDSDRIYRYQR